MTDLRIWIPGQDVYHAAFRMLRITSFAKTQLNLEKLFILDFLLAYPTLLHKVHMTLDIKREFRLLNSQKPEDFFLNLPSMVSLYRDMGVIQAEAVKSLVGKAILDKDLYLKQTILLDPNSVPKELKKEVDERNEQEKLAMKFLVEIYGSQSVAKLQESTSLKRKIY